MVFCIEKWMRQEQINTEHGNALKRIKSSLELKDRAIEELEANNAANKKMIVQLTECVSSFKESHAELKQSNAELREYHDKNLKYFETIIQNMITVDVFTKNVKWIAGLLVALTVIWKAFEALIQ